MANRGGGTSVGNLTSFLGLDDAGFRRGMENVNASMKRTSSALAQMGLAFGTAGAVLGVIQLTKKIFALGVAQEQINTSFEVFLGSVEKANVLIKQLTQFAGVTPFSSTEVFQGAKALLAFGFAGNQILPTLKMLGDVSAGTGKNLAELAVIYGQIKSAGRLMGQDLLQLINIGFNPLQIISKKTGESMAFLQDEMRKGAISFDMVEQAFKDTTSEGGLFFNMMEKQSNTVGGQMERLNDNIENVMKGLFKANSGPLKEFIENLAEISSNVNAIVEGLNLWIKYGPLLPFNTVWKFGADIKRELDSHKVQEKAVGGFRLMTKGMEDLNKEYEKYIALKKAVVTVVKPPTVKLKSGGKPKEGKKRTFKYDLPTEVKDTGNPFATQIEGVKEAAGAYAALILKLRNVKVAQDDAAVASHEAKRKLYNQLEAVQIFGSIMGSTIEDMIASQQTFATVMRATAIQIVNALQAIIIARLIEKAASDKSNITIWQALAGVAAAVVAGGVIKGILQKSLNESKNAQGLASGGYVTESGAFRVHKSEIVSLPAGSAVTPANTGKRGNGGGRLTTEITLRKFIIQLDREKERMGR